MQAHSDQRWLNRVVEHAVENGWCTKIFCTTCGATAFKERLRSALGLPNTKTKRRPLGYAPLLSQEAAMEVVEAMKGLPNPDRRLAAYKSAIRFILWHCREALGRTTGVQRMTEILGNSWSGDILNEMILHHEALMKAQLAHEQRNDPVRVAQRRDAAKAVRAQQHNWRLNAKKVRDQTWWRLVAVTHSNFGAPKKFFAETDQSETECGLANTTRSMSE